MPSKCLPTFWFPLDQLYKLFGMYVCNKGESYIFLLRSFQHCDPNSEGHHNLRVLSSSPCKDEDQLVSRLKLRIINKMSRRILTTANLSSAVDDRSKRIRVPASNHLKKSWVIKTTTLWKLIQFQTRLDTQMPILRDCKTRNWQKMVPLHPIGPTLKTWPCAASVSVGWLRYQGQNYVWGLKLEPNHQWSVATAAQPTTIKAVTISTNYTLSTRIYTSGSALLASCVRHAVVRLTRLPKVNSTWFDVIVVKSGSIDNV